MSSEKKLPGKLQKRKRGRPRKHPKKTKKLKKITPFEGVEGPGIGSMRNNDRTTVVKTKFLEDFSSDTENPMIESISIKGASSKQILTNTEPLRFAPCSDITVTDPALKEQIEQEKNRFFLSKLLQEIEEAESRVKVKVFVCRFCGKTFDKPSSLGGHTAKKHNGLSKKYKKRVNAARNRRTERDRNNFMKKKLVESIKKTKALAHHHTK
jgi:hypothetical protein